MKLMLKFKVPVERGNEIVKDGTMGRAIEHMMEALKPEAAYFTLIDGQRGGYLFFEESDQARLPQLNEPIFAALDASIEIVPVLSADDLKRGLAE